LVCKGLSRVHWYDYLSCGRLCGTILFILILSNYAVTQSKAFSIPLPTPKPSPTPSAMSQSLSINVKNFGAKCDGVTNDTTSIQNALNSASSSGNLTVLLPFGTCKITSGLILPSNITLQGTSISAPDAIGKAHNTSVIDASSLTSGTALSANGDATGITLKNFGLNGSVTGTTAVGINLGSFVTSSNIDNVYVFGFYYGIIIQFGQNIRILSVDVQQAIQGGLTIIAGMNINVFGSLIANSNSAGSGGAYNIGVVGGAQAVSFYNSISDEAFNSGSSSIYIGAANDINFNNMVVYLTKGGYGISIGDGTNNPTRVTLNNVRVVPFNVSEVPVNTIRIYGSGHSLINVTTNPNGGGDIQDNTNDSVYVNVNHKTLLSGGLQQLPVDPKPACSASLIGTTWFTPGSSGVKDTYEICAKAADDSYAWRTLY
jgi:hypothetical protein